MRKYKGWMRISAAMIAVCMVISAMAVLPTRAANEASKSEAAEAEAAAQAEQAAQSGETVRVGYYPVDQYQQVDDNGNYSGYAYDYFMQLQKYTKWNYEFVEASYADCYKMLLTGDIDIMSGMIKTPGRESQVLFSNASFSNTQNELYCRTDEDMYYEDYEAFDGCSVAILKGALQDELKQYAADHNFTINIVEYDTTEQLQEAVLNGEADMMFAASVSEGIDIKVVARLQKTPLYYGISKQKPELVEELDKAWDLIINNNPNFGTNMAEKYMVDGANASATFNKEEAEYIAEGETVYVIVNKDWAPISWYDEESKSYKGIAIDVAKQIEEYSGLHLEYCTEAEFNEIAAKDPSTINSVLAILADDNAWAVRQDVMMTNHIVDATVVMVTKRGAANVDMKDAKIALPKNFYITWRMQDEYAEDQIVYCDTAEECLEAINEGKADATFVNELVATYYLSMLEYSNLFATTHSGYEENLAFAINKYTDKPLLGIVDKAILCIGNNEMDQIVLQNSIADQRVSLRGLYYSNPMLVVTIIVLIVVILLLIIGVIYRAMEKRKRMAEELEREQETSNARTEFFMMISHEIRTPLNAVVGYLNLTEEECHKNGVEMEYLKRAQRAAAQMTDISEDMLDYTRIASDTATLQEKVFDLKSLVNEIEQNFSISALKKELDFQFTITDITHEYIYGDRLRIAQIMQNLLSNSVKFTDVGGKVRANVKQIEKEDGNIEIQFTAEDTGKGMSQEFLEKVCTPFKQGDRAYSRTHGGLGLGLYLAKYYIEAMNGHMDVTSELGKGSTFKVTLPLKKAATEEVLEKHISLAHVRAIIGGVDAEDNDQLKSVLKRLGMKSDVVDSEKLVLRRIQSRMGTAYAYNLCILDDSLLMGSNGAAGDDSEKLDILDEITKMENAPIVYVQTSKSDIVDALKKDKRIRQVLYKPIFQSVLFDAIMDTFGEYKAEEVIDLKDFTGVHAMIVEDNKINADILMRVLGKVNVESTLCENGQIAVDTFEKSPAGTFDIIFMDIQMPVMDGYEATRAIRNSRTQLTGLDIPIVAVSANAFPEDIEKSLACGMNEHFSKPIQNKRLYGAIEKYCHI